MTTLSAIVFVAGLLLAVGGGESLTRRARNARMAARIAARDEAAQLEEARRPFMPEAMREVDALTPAVASMAPPRPTPEGADAVRLVEVARAQQQAAATPSLGQAQRNALAAQQGSLGSRIISAQAAMLAGWSAGLAGQAGIGAQQVQQLLASPAPRPPQTVTIPYDWQFMDPAPNGWWRGIVDWYEPATQEFRLTQEAGRGRRVSREWLEANRRDMAEVLAGVRQLTDKVDEWLSRRPS